MKIVFKVTQLENKKDVEVLFGNADSYVGNTGLPTILNAMKDLMTEEQKEKIKLIDLYVGNYDFNDEIRDGCCKESFEILVKLQEDIPIKILQADGNNYLKLYNSCQLLNDENKEENISYKVFEVRGSIK